MTSAMHKVRMYYIGNYLLDDDMIIKTILCNNKLILASAMDG